MRKSWSAVQPPKYFCMPFYSIINVVWLFAGVCGVLQALRPSSVGHGTVCYNRLLASGNIVTVVFLGVILCCLWQ